MQLQDIAINNLRRRKGKMMFLVIGVMMGIATVVALFSLTSAMNRQLEQDLAEAGTKVLIVPRSDSVSFAFGGISVASDITFDATELPLATVNQLEATADQAEIRYIAPKKILAQEAEGIPVLMVGVDFSQELLVKPWLKIDGRIPENPQEIVLGTTVAEALHKHADESLTINGVSYKVTGIIQETGSQEDNVVMGFLGEVNRLSGTETVSLVELALKNTPGFVENVETLKKQFPDARVTPVKEVIESRKEVIERFERFALMVSLIMLLVATLIVITTITGSVNERFREIGIFRAIGFRKSHIIKIVLLEAGITCGVGGLVGCLTGIGLARLAVPLMEQSGLTVSLSPVLGVAMVAFAVLIGIGAGWPPAVKAANLDPAEALRYI